MENVEDGSIIYIPTSIKTISDDAFGENIPEDITIVSSDGSAAQTFAKKLNVRFEIGTIASETFEFHIGETKTVYSNGEITVKSSDTYRKYLATYTNLAVAGAEFVMLIGIVFISVESLISYFSKKKNGKEDRGYLRIVTSITLSGLFVTTVNTFILRSFLPAWEGRMFMILWIPRVAEELIVCIAQAYIISLLYGVIMNTKFKKYLMKTEISK